MQSCSPLGSILHMYMLYCSLFFIICVNFYFYIESDSCDILLMQVYLFCTEIKGKCCWVRKAMSVNFNRLKMFSQWKVPIKVLDRIIYEYNLEWGRKKTQTVMYVSCWFCIHDLFALPLTPSFSPLSPFPSSQCKAFDHLFSFLVFLYKEFYNLTLAFSRGLLICCVKHSQFTCTRHCLFPFFSLK